MKSLYFGYLELEAEVPILADDIREAAQILDENTSTILQNARLDGTGVNVRVSEFTGDTLPKDWEDKEPFRDDYEFPGSTCKQVFEEIQFLKAEAAKAARIKAELEAKQINFDDILFPNANPGI